MSQQTLQRERGPVLSALFLCLLTIAAAGCDITQLEDTPLTNTSSIVPTATVTTFKIASTPTDMPTSTPAATATPMITPTPTDTPTSMPTATAIATTTLTITSKPKTTDEPTSTPMPTPIPKPVQSQFANAWQKMREKRQAALATLPGYDEFPSSATTWRDYAQRTFDDLLTHDDCWFDEPSTGIRGFRPYVKGTDGWGGTTRTREITELMAEMDVLWPMFRYLQLHPDPERQAQVDEFINELPKYYDLATRQATNRPGEKKHDSWYFMENSVLKFGHLYLISGNPALQEPYWGSLSSALNMAHNFDYLFPQFVDLQKQRAAGYNTSNYSTAGLLAYSLIHAYQLTGDKAYLQEAEQALVRMYADAAPLDVLYEPQELAAATAAAAQMTRYAAEIDSTTDFADLATHFFYAQTWMVYYDGGQSDLPGFRLQRSDWLPKTWRDGLHAPYYNRVEFGGINAPAFKESFEAVLFWVDYLRYLYGTTGFDPVAPLKILNLTRIKNFYHFSPNIPDEWERDFGPVSLQYIPYEDIDYYAVRDYEDHSVREKAGYNGKQIYGAGETLWAYLAFEALGEAADRNSLILNLNLFDQAYPPAPEDRAYIVFNPYPDEKTLAFTLLHVTKPYNLYADGQELGDFEPGDSFEIILPGLGSALITLESAP